MITKEEIAHRLFVDFIPSLRSLNLHVFKKLDNEAIYW